MSDDPDEDDPVESFRSQMLNIWPQKRLSLTLKDEPLLPESVWAGCADVNEPMPHGRIVVAIEDYYGAGASAAAVGLSEDGKLVGWGDVFPSRREAFAWAGWIAYQRPDLTLVVGASMSGDPAVASVSAREVVAATGRDTRIALPVVRELASCVPPRIVHSDGPMLNRQILGLRVSTNVEGGLSVSPRSGRHDLARAFAWAVKVCSETAVQPFYVY